MSTTLTKADLVELIAQEHDMKKNHVTNLVNALFEVITDSVSKGERVSIPGFGIFESKVRSERKGRNPKTGEEITISASVVPTFKAGKQFKDKLTVQSE